MNVATDITIVGAGPYGLSIATHLRERGLDFRIVGSPMRNWLTNMPKGMCLKSAGFASTLFDPGRTFTLQHFCKDRDIPYQDVGLPVRLETFCAYGVAFQERFVPDLEDEKLIALNACPEGFELRMESGKSFKSRKVVLAVGIDYFRHIPEKLGHMPREIVSHSAEQHDLRKFRGQHVAVLGCGSSAIDIAILLRETLAKVQLIGRNPALSFGPDEGTLRSLTQRMRAPMSAVGPGWKNRICTEMPWLYRYLPDHLRLRTVKRFLGPSGGWFMKHRAALVPALLGYELLDAQVCDGRALLLLAAQDGSRRHVSADHVIAATGYQSDVRRVPFLSINILNRLNLIGRTPRLSPCFESSVPGLYFVGPISATSFGPVMRFVAGADFTSRRISQHLAQCLRTEFVREKPDPIPRPH